MQIAVIRIERTLKDFADMMNKLNLKMNSRGGGVTRTRSNKISEFTFAPLDASGKKALQDAGLKLYQQGVLSVHSLLTNFGYSAEQEASRLLTEQKAGYEDLFLPLRDRASNKEQDEQLEGGDPIEETRGRPTKDDADRTGDKDQAITGKMPKPSQPDNNPDI
jgi:hypothetical protein